MAVMLSKTYMALKEAGASDDKAMAAAEEIASYEKDITIIRNDLTEIKSDMKVMKWGIALIIAVVVLPYLKALFTPS